MAPPQGLTNPAGKQVAWWKRPFSRQKHGAIQLAGEEGEETVLRRKASTPGEKRTIFVAVVSRYVALIYSVLRLARARGGL